ncbi:unnamed protein product [[Candida] boidinii]|uniref:Unnamed protein product n=1 Tax=Candida boidinii TaxID=5477 RepID=A0ACB5U9Y3_CANBO|nr:unnamed protein product [[Candida] boidinii]
MGLDNEHDVRYVVVVDVEQRCVVDVGELLNVDVGDAIVNDVVGSCLIDDVEDVEDVGVVIDHLNELNHFDLILLETLIVYLNLVFLEYLI